MPRKAKEKEFVCGQCAYCDRELTNLNGYWVVGIERHPITKELLHFCHGSKKHNCFDNYGKLCREMEHKATGHWKKYTPYNTRIDRVSKSIKG